MSAFTIKDLENLSGIKAHTIRIWEQRYHFLKPDRTQTNIRYYSNDQLKTILNIALLNKYGYKISHIDRMSEDELNAKILTLSQIQAQQERVVNELIKQMIDINIDEFENILTAYIGAKGIEKTIIQILFPFLERIGILWLTNHINPAQEHLVSNIIRQKLIVGIDSMEQHLVQDKTVLLFLPSGEHHELGLLFMSYLLKRRGIKTLYLGSNVPLKDVASVVNFKKPLFIYTHLTSLPQKFNVEKYMDEIETLLSDYPVIMSGQLIQGFKKRVPANVQLKKSLPEVMDHIASV